MARKPKQRTKKPTDTGQQATLKALQTQLTDPRITQWLWSGSRGVRERIMRINYSVLRNCVDRLPLIGGIINTRSDQVLPYCRYAEEDRDRGYRFVLADRSANENEYSDREVDSLIHFMDQTGFDYDPEREDDFTDFVTMIVREIMVIDQISTEMQFNRIGDARAFWLLDGATIKRVSDVSEFKKGVRFVQEIDQQIYNRFTADMLIFDYKFKRADIRYRGYGYSPVEQALDIITTLLFGYNYIRDQLIRDRVPRGFISVMGDVGKPEMDAIRSYWYAAMTGAGASFNIPILPSGKEGVGIDFKMIGRSNKDMEYHKTMMFISSLVAAVFSIDLMEMGIKTDDTTRLLGENPEARIISSKERGMHSLLMFIQQYVNKILRKVDEKYKFEFTGVVQEDEDKRTTNRVKQIGGWRSIDDVRIEDGDEPYNEEWSKMPLHPQAVQIFLQKKTAEQQEKMGQQMGGNDFGGNGNANMFGGNKETEEEPAADNEDKEVEKSLRALEEFRKVTQQNSKVVRHIIE